MERAYNYFGFDQQTKERVRIANDVDQRGTHPAQRYHGSSIYCAQGTKAATVQ